MIKGLLWRIGRQPRSGAGGNTEEQSEEDRKLLSKANELWRSTKNIRTTGKGEIAKPAACCLLASEVLGDPIDHVKVRMLSGATEKVFENTVATLRTALNVKIKVSMHKLCLLYGCVRLEPAVRRLLQAYRERFVSQLPAAKRGTADFSNPVFALASFYLVAKKNGVKVDRVQLLQNYKVPLSEFARVVSSMSDLCSNILGNVLPGGRTKGKPKSKRGRSAHEGTDGTDGGSPKELEDVDALNAIYLANEDREAWKQRVIQQSQEVKPKAKKSKWKQTQLLLS